jgi:hypothetical protein
VGPRAGLDVLEKRKTSCPFERRTVQPVALAQYRLGDSSSGRIGTRSKLACQILLQTFNFRFSFSDKTWYRKTLYVTRFVVYRVTSNRELMWNLTFWWQWMRSLLSTGMGHCVVWRSYQHFAVTCCSHFVPTTNWLLDVEGLFFQTAIPTAITCFCYCAILVYFLFFLFLYFVFSKVCLHFLVLCVDFSSVLLLLSRP